MYCRRPFKGYVAGNGSWTPKRAESPSGQYMEIPCRRCPECRKLAVSEMTSRMICETQMHPRGEAIFATLTYDDAHLPWDYGVHKRHLQLFMKRLRNFCWKHYRVRIRFVGAAEYGGRTLRPHYHVIVWGWRPADLQMWTRTKDGHSLYRSASLESLWYLEDDETKGCAGQILVGEVTPQSAAYTAGYIMKKQARKADDASYLRVNPLDETGEIRRVSPEFWLCSRRPGIGGPFYEKYFSDCFPADFLVFNGSKVPVPRFFLEKLKVRDPELFEKVKSARLENAKEALRSDDNQPERLASRRKALDLRLENVRRDAFE